MEIPQSLADARGVTEEATRREVAVLSKMREISAASSLATSRIAELDREIQTLTGQILGDDALAGVAEDERLAADARAGIERRAAALGAERDELQVNVKGIPASQAALAEVLQTRRQTVVEAAKAFLVEWRQFQASVWVELGEDVGRMALPRLLEKWFSIADGLNFVGLRDNLQGLKIIGMKPVFGHSGYRHPTTLEWIPTVIGTRPTLAAGVYHDPITDKAIDCRTAWRSDASLVELNAALISFNAFKTTAEAIVKAPLNMERRINEDARLDEGARAARMAAKPKGYLTTVANPPVPADTLATTGYSPIAKVMDLDSPEGRRGGTLTPF